MQLTSNCGTVAPQTSSEATDELPLVDERLQAEWREDLSTDDIRQILAHARLEAEKSLDLIQDAALRRDLTALKRSAHKLKGMAGNLGAVRIVALLREIEVGAADGDEPLVAIAKIERVMGDTLQAFEAAA